MYPLAHHKNLFEKLEQDQKKKKLDEEKLKMENQNRTKLVFNPTSTPSETTKIRDLAEKSATTISEHFSKF